MYAFSEEDFVYNSFVKVCRNKISLIYLLSVTLHLKSECSTGYNYIVNAQLEIQLYTECSTGYRRGCC